MFYRWIVIENSLTDTNILKKYPILSETIFAENDSSGRRSRMCKIQVPEEDINALINILTTNTKYPYYSHFYHEDPKVNSLIVVFHGKRIDTKKDNFQIAIDYGIAHGVSREEMHIEPREISRESW